ncbi:MAG: hypothetical protein IKI11_00315 [Neisseriaceae bacterium]|nr:hypothetical protein [Neisseriaceae bacterium]
MAKKILIIGGCRVGLRPTVTNKTSNINKSFRQPERFLSVTVGKNAHPITKPCGFVVG